MAYELLICVAIKWANNLGATPAQAKKKKTGKEENKKKIE